MAYRVKTPHILSKVLYRNLIWKMPTSNAPTVYLTFDDGPHPDVTPFVLQQLAQHNAKASFFCIGDNVTKHQEIYRSLLEAGHTIGNHTQNHLNGWFTKKSRYLSNVTEAAEHIDSKLFRPPYGRITRGQINALSKSTQAFKIIMWDVLSGDFDTSITGEECLNNVVNNIEDGSIVVFHDSKKAWDRMSYALPKVLRYCKEHNFELKALPTH